VGAGGDENDDVLEPDDAVELVEAGLPRDDGSPP
jgi:hypothetical protein